MNMKNRSLDYVVGKIDIERPSLKAEGEDIYNEAHKFIIQKQKNKLVLYMMKQPDHYLVNLRFRLNERNLVGGGLCYIDSKGMLVFGDYSGYYGALPKGAAERFANLVAEYLKEKGIAANGVIVNSDESKINRFWKKKVLEI